MKNLFAILLIVWMTIPSYALPVGNPSEASVLCRGVFFNNPYYTDCDEGCGFFSLRAGYYGDFVFQRSMRLASSPHKYINVTEIHTNAAYLAANFFDRIDLFTTLGVSNIRFIANDTLFADIPGTDTGIVTSIQTKTDFSWSIGARASLLEWCRFACGIEGQYFKFSPKKIQYIIPAFQQSTTDSTDYDFRYDEWQVGAGISYQLLEMVLPYIAVKYSRARVNVNTITDPTVFFGPFTFADLKSARHWGGAIGVLIKAYNCMALTIEGRIIDENALYVNAQVRF